MLRLPPSLLLCCLVAGNSLAARAQDADPRRPPVIQATGVPVIPGALLERLRQYQSTRSAAFRGWAPDGRGMLIQTQFGSTAQLHRVLEPGGARQQATFFEEPVDGRFLPGRTDGSLLLESSRGGDENFQLHIRRGQYGLPQLWTDGKARHLLGAVNDAGTAAIVACNRRNGRDMDLFLVPLDEQRPWTELLRVDNETWNVHDWSVDGRLVLVSRYVSINESHPAVLDVASKQLTRLPIPPGGAAPAAYGHLKFAPDNKTAYLTTDAASELHQLYRLDLPSGTYTQPRAWQTRLANVEAVEVDRKSGRVACVVNDQGYGRLRLIEGDEVQDLDVPAGIVAGPEFSPDGQHLGFTLARPDRPAEAYSWSFAERATPWKQWTFSETGGLDPERFLAPDLVSFSTFDGRQIPAFYYRPRQAAADRKAPVLIQIHGGPEGQSRPVFSGLDQFWLNEVGVAVIAPNVRGSNGYGKTYLTLDNGPQREDSVRDIGALLDWIARQPELDASRVAVTGGSYGGYMVLASLTHFPDRIRAGIDIVGIANFITFLETTSEYRRNLRRAEYGDERDPAMRAVFARINPTANAGKIRSALLVAHGRNDPRVPFSEAELIAPLVRKNGVDVWTIYADNEGHGFRRRENRDYLTAATVLFLQQHLQPDRR